MKTLVTAIQKGGQGKTFATCHLAFDFQERGLRVAVIDLDTQGNASWTLAGHDSGSIAAQLLQLHAACLDHAAVFVAQRVDVHGRARHLQPGERVHARVAVVHGGGDRPAGEYSPDPGAADLPVQPSPVAAYRRRRHSPDHAGV